MVHTSEAADQQTVIWLTQAEARQSSRQKPGHPAAPAS
jgi:hypothetical protein